MPKLSVLDLDFNKLESLPQSLIEAPHFAHLFLPNNGQKFIFEKDFLKILIQNRNNFLRISVFLQRQQNVFSLKNVNLHF